MPRSVPGEYQQKVEECLANAARMPGCREKAEWLNLAESWLRMAAEARRPMFPFGSKARARDLQRKPGRLTSARRKVWRPSCCSARALHSVPHRARETQAHAHSD
jgi:hypothetical protein